MIGPRKAPGPWMLELIGDVEYRFTSRRAGRSITVRQHFDLRVARIEVHPTFP